MPQGTIAASGGKLLVDLIQQLTGDLKSERHCPGSHAFYLLLTSNLRHVPTHSPALPETDDQLDRYCSNVAS